MLVDLHQSHKISEKVKPIKWQIGKQSISIKIKSSNIIKLLYIFSYQSVLFIKNGQHYIELEDMVHIATKIEM
jgi:hypothetical protein